MDYPSAFDISNSVLPEKHHPKCSARSGMLCDCEVLFTHPDYIKDYGEHEITWETYGYWKDGKWVQK